MRSAVLIVALLLTAAPAAACPMCKAANEAPQQENGADADLRPRAYMYSIFFMMGMPVVAGAGIVLGVRREVQKASQRDL